MIWIHGGSYVSGGGDIPLYDPTALVRENNVIVVNLTYRLGIFGFLGRGRDVPANLGLLDLIEALRWVKRNISSLGGDPNNVTLFGQSAGGDAIVHLMISDGTIGLFHRVVIQSAPLGIRRRREKMTKAMARAAGPVAGSIATVDELLVIQNRAQRAAARFGLKGNMPFGPEYGHAPLPEAREAERCWAVACSHLDVLIGWTAEETAAFAYLSAPIRRLFSMPVLGKTIRKMAINTTTNLVYRSPSREFARMLAASGANVTEYEYAWRPAASPIGAGHMLELAMLFPRPDAWSGAPLIGSTPANALVEMGRPLRGYWATFARSGEAPLELKQGRVPDLKAAPVRIKL
jgi:para-nitrobenzyl esterase